MKKWIGIFLFSLFTHHLIAIDLSLFELNKWDIQKSLAILIPEKGLEFGILPRETAGRCWFAFAGGNNRSDVNTARACLDLRLQPDSLQDVSINVLYIPNEPRIVRAVLRVEDTARRGHFNQGPLPAAIAKEKGIVFSKDSLFATGEKFGDWMFSYDGEAIERAMGAKDGDGKNVNGAMTTYSCFRHFVFFGIGDIGFFIKIQKSMTTSVPFDLKNIAANTAKVYAKKTEVALGLDHVDFSLKTITNKGILNSLQAKLDNFKNHFKKGAYNTAINVINAFLNELTAQRGKHVPEATYQALKTQAETMIQSVNFLMNPALIPTSTPAPQPKK